MPPDQRLRLATLADVPQMMDILNHEIANTVNSFRLKPMTPQEGAKWWHAREGGRYPAWVAESVPAKVLGWASLSRWSGYEGYAGTAEVSIWITPSAQGKGLGKALFSLLVDYARQGRFRVLLSRVEANNRASLALHEKFGFTTIGTMHRVGEKFNRFLDVTLLELQLDMLDA